MRLLLVLLPLLPLSLSATADANPVQRENARAGSGGWQIPADAGRYISGYSSETSVAPGQSFHVHVRAPLGSRYRIELYRLGWYHAAGGRRLTCVPGCASTRSAVPQPASSSPEPGSGLIRTRWTPTDVVPISRRWISGYYEAKLIVVAGPAAGAVGRIPLVVRESHPAAAVLVQVPVNTWQAYDTWGGKSLYSGDDGQRAFKVSFDRPYAEDVAVPVVFMLELQEVRYLERKGIDVAYQSDVDTDRVPDSLLQHRLVITAGHDEYWTQRMRDAFDRALARGTNMAFGSNTGMWRIRYEDRRRTVVEWRDRRDDPVHDLRYTTNEFRFLGQPECRLMGVQYEYYTHRLASLPPTPYTVVGAASDAWLSAGGLRPGDVIPGVVGYEWDSYKPGCFRGRVVRLLHAIEPGADGIPRSADAVRATAPSGARVFGMGTMELSWALDDFGGHTPDPRVQGLMSAALADLQTPAPPARLTVTRVGGRVSLHAQLRSDDPRILRVSVARGSTTECRDALLHRCIVTAPRRRTRYRAVAIDRWGHSTLVLSGFVGPPRR